MAMSHLYSKFAQMKRNSEPGTPAYMSFSQTPWINGEKSKEKFCCRRRCWSLEEKMFCLFEKPLVSQHFFFPFSTLALPNS